ncbi:MAG: TetR/AcrR family transcriptional regulator [Veillonellales bacterium]
MKQGKDTEKDSRLKLIEAATPLFAKRGFAAVSIRQLAEAAGVNSAMISYHFGSKENLYKEVLEQQFFQALKIVEAVWTKELTPEERIQCYGRCIGRIHNRFPYLLSFVHSELTNPTACFDTVIRKFIPVLYDRLCRIFQGGIEQGQFRSELNPAFMAVSLAGIMNFYFIIKPLASKMLPPTVAQEENFIEQALKIFLSGVKPNG